MGFTVRLKKGGVLMEDALYTIDGEAVSTAQIQGEQQAMALEQQIQQQEQMAQQGEGDAEGGAKEAEGGAEGETATDVGGG